MIEASCRHMLGRCTLKKYFPMFCLLLHLKCIHASLEWNYPMQASHHDTCQNWGMRAKSEFGMLSVACDFARGWSCKAASAMENILEVVKLQLWGFEF